MAYIKEKIEQNHINNWLLTNKLDFPIGKAWAIDKQTHNFLSFLTIDRESNENNLLLEYYSFFYKGMSYILGIQQKEIVGKTVIYIIEEINPKATIDEEFLSELSKALNVFKQYDSLITTLKVTEETFIVKA